jgi:hypothetical protein
LCDCAGAEHKSHSKNENDDVLHAISRAAGSNCQAAFSPAS